MDAEKLADEARNSISRYCFEECKAYCCRKGYLIITPEQIDTVLNDKRKELEKKGFVKKLDNGNYSFYLGNPEGCPGLDGQFKCKIHKSDKRPIACAQFPIFIFGKTVKLSKRCPAVKEGKFYVYVKQFINNGFKVIESEFLSDSDFYKIK